VIPTTSRPFLSNDHKPEKRREATIFPPPESVFEKIFSFSFARMWPPFKGGKELEEGQTRSIDLYLLDNA
jgi:hypothetical protein